MTPPMILPPRLKPGDQIVVVSPSSTIRGQRDRAEIAAANLAAALDVRVEFAAHAFGAHYYSAAAPRDRADDLMRAIIDPDVSAVVLSVGGATAIDVVDLLDYEAIAAHPTVIAGISDSTTVLQAVTARTGLVTFHGLELFDFARGPLPYTTASLTATWFDAWHGPWHPNPDWRDLDDEPTAYDGWRPIAPGTATGRVVGGNSEAFTQLLGTPYTPALDGAILVLETYRLHKRHIHALLVSLRLRGILDSIAGLVIGYCLGSDTPGSGNDRDLADLVTEATADSDLPILHVGEIGHQVENLVLPLGATLALDTTTPTPTLALTHPTVTTLHDGAGIETS